MRLRDVPESPNEIDQDLNPALYVFSPQLFPLDQWWVLKRQLVLESPEELLKQVMLTSPPRFYLFINYFFNVSNFISILVNV